MISSIKALNTVLGRGGEGLRLLGTLAVRHSGAGQTCVRSGKRIVAKGKKKRTMLVIAVIRVRIGVLRTHGI